MQQLPNDKNLPIEKLAACFNNTSATYKFYWLLSIVDALEARIESQSTMIAKKELFARMISNAWYTVNYFHVSFGVQDKLQSAILAIKISEGLTIDANKNDIIKKLLNTENSVTKKQLVQFNNNVPHWFLSPWFPGEDNASIYRKSNQSPFYCPYALHIDFIDLDILWANYFLLNAAFIRDFCYWNLSLFLQVKNPNTLKNHRDKFDFLNSTERKGWTPRNGSHEKLDNSELWPYDDIYNELKDKTFEEVRNIIKSIEKKSYTKVKRTEDNTNYVLILDEINRANISKVFGELITLLEEDKRIGKENELSVTLPSGELFSVPPNLYIIGTMNTADKSISLVDIALRRRFQFIPIYPDSSIIMKYCKSADKADKVEFMDLLNSRLRVEKGVDFQIGHAYFLKDNSLAGVINENVIPLLTEYYRNDLEKVKKLLSDLGKPLDDDHYNKTGLLKYIG